MVYIASNGVGKSYGIKHYIVDEDSDVKLLPINVLMGCTAYCIETGKSYMINSAGKWIEIASGNSSGNGSGGNSSGSGSGSGGNTGGGGSGDNDGDNTSSDCNCSSSSCCTWTDMDGNNSSCHDCCEWVDMDGNGSSGDDSGDSDSEDEDEYEIIYDGGEEI